VTGTAIGRCGDGESLRVGVPLVERESGPPVRCGEGENFRTGVAPSDLASYSDVIRRGEAL
jgi:hypothetical protein